MQGKRIAISLAIFLVAGVVGYARERSTAQSPRTPVQQENAAMVYTAKGTFKVKLLPLAADAHGPEIPIGRMSIDKQFEGDMVGTSQGQMLMMRTAVEGSAAYVAIEVVTATLNGDHGTFALHHKGTMDRGVGKMSVTVVPDSGTDELQGIAGDFVISIVAGVHDYVFTYTVPERR
jgi:hypothetical protein